MKHIIIFGKLDNDTVTSDCGLVIGGDNIYDGFYFQQGADLFTGNLTRWRLP